MKKLHNYGNDDDDGFVDDGLDEYSAQFNQDAKLIAAGAVKSLSKDKQKEKDLADFDRTKATAIERDVELEESGVSATQLAKIKEQLEKIDTSQYHNREFVYREVLSLKFGDVGADTDQVLIVDGDSLLIELLHDSLLYWQHSDDDPADPQSIIVGGQYLHLIYLCERYIDRLREGGRPFRLVWFKVNERLFPINTHSDLTLLREIIRLHLSENCQILTSEFENWWDDTLFKEWMNQLDPSFVLLADGTADAYTKMADSSITAAHIQCLTLQLLSLNFRCVRLTELQFHAGGIKGFEYGSTMQYRFWARQQGIDKYMPDDEKEQRFVSYRERAETEFDQKVLEALTMSIANGDSRQLVTLYSIVKLLQSNDQTLAESIKPLSTVDICKALLINTALLQTLPLTKRAFDAADLTDKDEQSAKKYTPLLTRFFANATAAMLQLKPEQLKTQTFIDIYDHRLFLQLIIKLSSKSHSQLGLTIAQAAQLNQLWAIIASIISSTSKGFLPAFGLEALSPSVDVITAEEEERERLEKETRLEEEIAVKRAKEAEEALKKQDNDAKKPSNEVPASWDDGDDTDVGDSWEDLLSDEETKEKVDEDPGSTDPGFREDALLTVAQINNDLIQTLTAEAEHGLNDLQLIVQKNENEDLLEFYKQDGTWAFGKHLPDGLPNPNPLAHQMDRRELKKRQQFLNFMTRYSKSLIGGRVVMREVEVSDSGLKDSTAEQDGAKNSEAEEGTKSNNKKGEKGGKGKKPKPGTKGASKKQAGVIDIKQQIKDQLAQKHRDAEAEKVQRLINQAKFQSSLDARINWLDNALEQYADSTVVPGLFTLIDWNMIRWKECCDDEIVKWQPSSIEYALRIFTLVQDIYRRFKRQISLSDLQNLQKPLYTLGFTDTVQALLADYRANVNAAAVGKDSEVVAKKFMDEQYSLSMSAVRFQLKYGGPYMLRNVDSRYDPRVSGFYPDNWQRDLLDIVDAEESALICAPTSAGKTFISYYVMQNVISDNRNIERTKDRGVVVYVAPTKALLTQVQADLYRRFGPVFGVLADYNVEVFTSEVLVTLPRQFESILMSPERESWIKQIKYVIFDEIHQISGEEGLVWERCLSLLRAPFLALSATVGNPHLFENWLQRIQYYCNRKVHLIVHKTRWADLEKYMYLPKAPLKPEAADAQFIRITDIHTHKIKNIASTRIHPCAAINSVSDFDNTQSFPSELAFAPNDSLSLYDAISEIIYKHSDSFSAELKDDFAKLKPEDHFSHLIISKKNSLDYENKLKDTLTHWIHNGLAEKVNAVMESLSSELKQKIKDTEAKQAAGSSETCYDVDFQTRHFLPMLLELNAIDKLPAIVFCFDRDMCEHLVITTEKILSDLELATRQAEDSQFEAKQKQREKEKKLKALKRARDKELKNRTAEEEAREDAEFNYEIEEEGDDDKVDPRFSFLKPGEAMDQTEMDWWVKRAMYKMQIKRDHPLIRCLYRGIGVHHNGLNKQYRDMVETLFRGRHLKVLVATSSLAVGVNLPSRTSVFCGDSKFLNPLQYRQMSGRAGRRGFDSVGNVVFFAIPPRKIYRLLKSPLTSLRGHFPLTTTLGLRLAEHHSRVKDPLLSIQTKLPLIREPFFQQSYPGKHLLSQLQYHLRFSYDYLWKKFCIDNNGKPRNLNALVSLLHEVEPNNYAFVSLLESGYLGRLCSKFNEKDTTNGVPLKLLNLLAHLFVRQPLPATVNRADFPDAGDSLIILEELDDEASEIITEHNFSVLTEFTNYVRVFAKQELQKQRRKQHELFLQQQKEEELTRAVNKLTIEDEAQLSTETQADEPEPKTKCYLRMPTETEAPTKLDKKALRKARLAEEREKKLQSKEEEKKQEMNNNIHPVEPLQPKKVRVEKPELMIDPSMPKIVEDLTSLPVSGAKFPRMWNTLTCSLASALMQQAPLLDARSPFVALSGCSDDFDSSRELSETIRSGIYLDPRLIPVVEQVDLRGRPLKLNAYIVDFYRNGNFDALITRNRLLHGAAWDLCKEWDNLLERLTTALKELQKSNEIQQAESAQNNEPDRQSKTTNKNNSANESKSPQTIECDKIVSAFSHLHHTFHQMFETIGARKDV